MLQSRQQFLTETYSNIFNQRSELVEYNIFSLTLREYK